MSFGIPVRNGLGLGLLASTSLSTVNGSPFSPLSLFAANEPGGWYDPSDLTTLYQDSAGTTPVTAVEQPVGLMLDKSRGLVLGPELVTNGDFASGTTGWTAVAGSISIVGGKLRVTQTNAIFAGAYQAVSLTAGVTYKFVFPTFTGTALAGYVEVFTSVPTAWDTGVAALSNTGTLYYTAPSTATYYIGVGNRGSNTVGLYSDWTSLSVKSIAGAHLTQSTSTARPVLSARKNRLVGTDVLATQNATTRAVGHVLSFWGTGTVTLSGTSTAGPLVGTGASNRVSLAFTPTAGTLTLTVSGSVLKAQLEEINERP